MSFTCTCYFIVSFVIGYFFDFSLAVDCYVFILAHIPDVWQFYFGNVACRHSKFNINVTIGVYPFCVGVSEVSIANSECGAGNWPGLLRLFLLS